MTDEEYEDNLDEMFDILLDIENDNIIQDNQETLY